MNFNIICINILNIIIINVNSSLQQKINKKINKNIIKSEYFIFKKNFKKMKK